MNRVKIINKQKNDAEKSKSPISSFALGASGKFSLQKKHTMKNKKNGGLISSPNPFSESFKE